MSGGSEALLEGRVRRQDGVLAQEAHGQTVLLRLEDGGYYALDEVGAMIWELCDGGREHAYPRQQEELTWALELPQSSHPAT